MPEQPIFYPVTNEAYAIEINQWHIQQFGCGYVMQFSVKDVLMARYHIETVGAKRHTEWWIPAEDLEAMNNNIIGLIGCGTGRGTK